MNDKAHPQDEQFLIDNGEARSYAFLGIHEIAPIYEVDKDGNQVIKEPAKTVARVRMFIGDEEPIDEDFDYPVTITPEQQLEPAILARIAKLGGE